MSSDLRTPAGPFARRSTEARRRRPRVTEGRLVFTVAAACYLGVAWWFWHGNLILVDSLSRVGNAYYILFSRDPHLAAVGFVWNPLPSLVLLPVLPLKALMPALTRDGLIGMLSSALFMAGVAAVGNDILRKLRVSLVPRAVLTIMLAAHPMLLLYSGTGLSEACFLFFLSLSARGLLRWLSDGRPESLVPLGLSLGLAYGARYEALAPGLAVPTVVAAVSFWRSRHLSTRRLAMATTDAVLVGLPVVVAVAGWAVASKAIVDQWLPTISSVYGNSANVGTYVRSIESATGHTLDTKIVYGLQQLLGLEPLAPLLLILAAVLAIRRRDLRVLAPLAVFGSVLAFDNLTFLTGNTFGWLRFQIVVVPLTILLAGSVLAESDKGMDAPSAMTAGPGSARRLPVHRRWVAPVTVALATALAVPSTVVTLNSPMLAREETDWFTEVGAERIAGLARLHTRIARELDDMALPEGSVITDSAYAFAIILASRNPRQFVITSDRDFEAVLADPRTHRVRYLLISADGAADAVRRAHPDMDRSQPGRQGLRTWVDRDGALRWTLVPVPGAP